MQLLVLLTATLLGFGEAFSSRPAFIQPRALKATPVRTSSFLAPRALGGNPRSQVVAAAAPIGGLEASPLSIAGLEDVLVGFVSGGGLLLVPILGAVLVVGIIGGVIVWSAQPAINDDEDD
mmetsp:Transcript_68110/g.154079  ORF Transcript_68110/g.154079 Transcript_68110/m.154079 type:complete len:121 (+) Transcript_68110:93-455(+)|eukprot:CAMPEP_0172583604 /NCGR_PEP_ID=MMETSP1068-20121228/3217_1 /TAXON_ID=35684 /ORGANISM="Pseudopedinella elastica, Strain CCMP716" /LENGTH=120 /DNA_ID=CAMNT_0013377467 /DNA_START=93 /DNA_END=455 /DNA_ORIENTATION=-